MLFRKLGATTASRCLAVSGNTAVAAVPLQRFALATTTASITVTQRRYATTTTDNKADDDDDFVDIMFPGDGDHETLGAAATGTGSSSAITAGTSNQLQTTEADEEDLLVLGVQRDEPLKDGEYATRLGIVTDRVDNSVRQGTRSHALQDKPDSRSDLDKANGEYDDEGGLAGDVMDGDEDMPMNGKLGAEEEAFMPGEAEAEEDTFTPNEGLKGIELPYEDEKFAETILQMEVEGQLDESWQNRRRAKIEDCKEIVDILKHMKARDTCCIDVSQKTSNFDYIIFATCEGPRHVHLCSWSISKADSKSRVSKPKRRSSDRTWDIVPVGRIIVNLMTDSVRSQFSLERKWAVTKTMDPLDHANATVSEGRTVKSHGLWTLTLNLQDLEDFEVDYCKDALLAQL